MADAATLADRFYLALARHHGEAMAECYADDARFSDPVFPDLRGERIRDMWRMLTLRGLDLRVEHEVLGIGRDSAHVRWNAWYSFSGSGRPVHNIITSHLALRDGLIVQQRDEFDFHRWARQALGWKGALFGGSAWLRSQVRAKAAYTLDRFIAGKS